MPRNQTEKCPLLVLPSLAILMCTLPACTLDGGCGLNWGPGPSSASSCGSGSSVAVRMASLTGTVRSAGGGAIPGATVAILDGFYAGRTALTDSQGAYYFDNLLPGNANLSATASGYREARSGLYFNGSNRLDFTGCATWMWTLM